MTDLWGALDFFDGGKHWTKGSLWHRESACALGGIQMARGVNLDKASLYPKGDDLDVIELASVVQSQFPDRVTESAKGDPLTTITGFNDDDDTSFEDVRMVFEKAAIRRDEILS